MEIPKNNTGLSGEFFVAAELYRRGWMVGLTIGNTKGVDITAQKEDNEVVLIQVKSIYKKKNVCWQLMKNSMKRNAIYIFVNLNADKMEKPDYFICTSDEVLKKIKPYASRDIVDLATIDSSDYKERWDKLEKKKIKV